MEYQIVRSGAQVLAEQVVARIAGWLTEKRLLVSENRPLEAGDVLILVHRRKPLVMPLIRALERLHVPVAGIDRLMLSEHLAVKDLLALMRWCGQVADDLALAQVLRSPIIGISDEALRALAYGRSASLWAQVKASEHAELLDRWLSMRDALPYDFLTDVLEVMGTRTPFAQRFGGEVHEVLDELKEQAASMPASMPCNLTHFVDWVSGSRRSIKREQETASINQVRIMTVHGAKGLEAPVVLMVDTDSVPDTSREIVYFSTTEHGDILPVVGLSDEAKLAPLRESAKEKKRGELVDEYQRLLYVALTRARDELHVFGFARQSDKPSDAWYDTIQASMQALGAEQTPDGLLLRDGCDGRAAALAPVQSKEPLMEHGRLPLWLKLPAPLPKNAAIANRPSLSPSRRDAGFDATPDLKLDAKPYGAEYAGKAKARGVRIHRVLQMLHAASDDAQIARYVRLVAPDWSAQQQQSVAAEVSALFHQHRFLWEHRSHAEVSIAGTITINGVETPVQGQIDLLVETPSEVVAVDYKTGRHVPSSPMQVPENYRLQMKTYQALLRQIHGEKPVRVALLWTLAPSLMWLDAEVENTRWNRTLGA
jgi:ATP-dependent helicase/nuclease subunit A